MTVNVRKHLPKLTLAFCAAMLVLGSIFAPVRKAEAGPFKIMVNHHGNALCVDMDALNQHLNHGDSTDFQPCS